MTNLSVKIGKLKLNNPVMVASGTFGYAAEFADFLNLKKLGAIVTKTITLLQRKGNAMPRTCETPAGMLNSIGLENPGLQVFIKEKLPYLARLGVPLIVSIASEKDPKEFTIIAEELDKIKSISAIELNISCPNIHGRSARLIAQDPAAACRVIRAARKATSKVIITKLSPNVTDIAQIALAAQKAGSDAVSLINTLTGMSIDPLTRRAKISAGIAGLSGPAIRPVAVRCCWEVFQKIKIPIIGMGGIIDTSSALEFFLAGATCVSVGTVNFINPKASVEIIEGIREYLRENKLTGMKEVIGSLEL